MQTTEPSAARRPTAPVGAAFGIMQGMGPLLLVVTVAGIGAILLSAQAVMDRHPVPAIGAAAFACGMQNGLAARFRGIVLRTTHVTGLVTDFGTTLGMRLRGFAIPGWKIAVPALLTAAFFAGGALDSPRKSRLMMSARSSGMASRTLRSAPIWSR